MPELLGGSECILVCGTGVCSARQQESCPRVGWGNVQLYLAKGVSDVPYDHEMVLGKLGVPLSCSFVPNQLPGNSRHL